MQASKDGVDVVCELAGEPREDVERIQKAIMSLQLEQATLDRKVKVAKKPVTRFKGQTTRLQKSLDELEFQLQTLRGKRKPWCLLHKFSKVDHRHARVPSKLWSTLLAFTEGSDSMKIVVMCHIAGALIEQLSTCLLDPSSPLDGRLACSCGHANQYRIILLRGCWCSGKTIWQPHLIT